jgi:hypothetical protein
MGAASHIGHGNNPPTEQAWKDAEPSVLWGAEDNGCRARIGQGWLRIDCKAVMNDPKTLAFLPPQGNGVCTAAGTIIPSRLCFL